MNATQKQIVSGIRGEMIDLLRAEQKAIDSWSGAPLSECPTIQEMGERRERFVTLCAFMKEPRDLHFWLMKAYNKHGDELYAIVAKEAGVT